MRTRTKIIIGLVVGTILLSGVLGVLMLVGSLRYVAIQSSAQPEPYFRTVSEVLDGGSSLVGRSLRVSGAVIGSSILVDQSLHTVSFEIANVPATYTEVEQQGGLAAVLKHAVEEANSPKLQVQYVGAPPLLLSGGAQAIIIGQLDTHGILLADEILMKCPARYAGALPMQAVDAP